MDLKGVKIGVLGGGVSAEREISLVSAKAVYEALLKIGLKAVFMDIATSQRAEAKAFIRSFEIDLAFVALHGEFGEDGKIQQILEELDIAYTGSGPKASFLAMDKSLSKEIFVKNDILTAGFSVYAQSEAISLNRPLPVVVKPHFSGSSLGVSIVRQLSGLKDALAKAFSYSSKVIVEDYIEGRELTVGILGESPLAVVEIIPAKGYYDFQAKYSEGGSQFIYPANLNGKTYRAVQALALAAHKVLGCRHFSRADLRLNQQNVPYLLEVNSIPGFTSHSLLPLSAKACGISFTELVLSIVNLAFYARKVIQKV